jgi:hypothetical protein
MRHYVSGKREPRVPRFRVSTCDADPRHPRPANSSWSLPDALAGFGIVAKSGWRSDTVRRAHNRL